MRHLFKIMQMTNTEKIFLVNDKVFFSDKPMISELKKIIIIKYLKISAAIFSIFHFIKYFLSSYATSGGAECVIETMILCLGLIGIMCILNIVGFDASAFTSRYNFFVISKGVIEQRMVRVNIFLKFSSSYYISDSVEYVSYDEFLSEYCSDKVIANIAIALSKKNDVSLKNEDKLKILEEKISSQKEKQKIMDNL